MSILFKAHGKSSFGLLVIRLILGSYTLALGIMQASDIEGYINKIKSFGILSQNLSFIVGFVTPFLLIIFGALYIMGFFTPASSFILGLIQIIKILSRGIFISNTIPFNKDLIFLACFILTFFSGAGVISFDYFLDKKKKPKEIQSQKTATVTAEIITDTKSTESAPSGETQKQ
jgi:uncharacterized membrane protein YphA (DoxX/SURF4 family)